MAPTASAVQIATVMTDLPLNLLGSRSNLADEGSGDRIPNTLE